MAQRVHVLLVCDLHDDDTTGTETVRFSLDGVGYEIDVCDAHGRALRDAFAPYVGAGRRATGRAALGARRQRRSGSGQAAAVREWARGQGLPVPDRGRVPADLAERYAAAHR
jgi:Lsr2